MVAAPKGDFAVRLLTALVLIPTVLFLTWHPSLQLGFSLFVAALVAIGLYEYYAIVRARNISPETIGGMLGGTAIAFSGHFSNLTVTNLMLYGAVLLVASLHIVRGQIGIAGLSSTVFGVFYVGWFGAHFTLLRAEPESGPELITLLIVALALSDTGAYLIGRAIGRHKLAPIVSPGKTWEGAVGGFLLAILGMVALHELRRRGLLERLPDWSLLRYASVGAILAITGQVGDLAESVLKRDAGVKDSGSIFPGHGGVLDRCDSFLFAAPVLYYIVRPLTMP